MQETGKKSEIIEYRCKNHVKKYNHNNKNSSIDETNREMRSNIERNLNGIENDLAWFISVKKRQSSRV